MKHTEHYQLSQFESDDRIMKEDFNDNNAKIDAAIAAAADSGLKVMLGTWTGDGNNSRTITLPVTPQLLILMGKSGSIGMTGICLQDCGRFISEYGSDDSANYFRLVGNTIRFTSIFFNNQNDTVHYFALY